MAGANLFNSIQVKRPGRSAFDLSHDVKLSLNMGNLVPTLFLDCVPGDSFNIGCESLLRFTPLVAPMMHRVDVYMHYFFVPYRLLWDNFEKFITNTEVDDALPVAPRMIIVGDPVTNYSRLQDYFGIPDPVTLDIEEEYVSPFYLSAYQFIYNEYYRDQNLIDEVLYKLPDGDTSADPLLEASLITMRVRAWEHDYFTACLPFAQKGDPVTIPITGFTDVPVKFYDNTQPLGTNFTWNASGPGGNRTVNVDSDAPVAGSNVQLQDIFAETSELESQAATINDLRTAYRVQEWLELAARGGTRLKEWIWTMFGVRSSDARLDRPEYITGTKSPVIISEVLNTTGTDDAPQGNMAGHGVSVTAGKYGNYRVEEYGCIIGIMSVMPKTAYQQGIHRTMIWRNDPTQYYNPRFDHLGEQAVMQNEIAAFVTGSRTTEFGFVPRFAEYKYMPSRVAGQFRTTLAFWHLGRIFDLTAPPQLNQEFIECVPRSDIFAVVDPAEDKLLCQVVHKIRAVRPMSKYSTPIT